VASPTCAGHGSNTSPTEAKLCMPISVNRSKSATSGRTNNNIASRDIFGLPAIHWDTNKKYCAFH
jgi:hypothetical protein